MSSPSGQSGSGNSYRESSRTAKARTSPLCGASRLRTPAITTTRTASRRWCSTTPSTQVRGMRSCTCAMLCTAWRTSLSQCPRRRRARIEGPSRISSVGSTTPRRRNAAARPSSPCRRRCSTSACSHLHERIIVRMCSATTGAFASCWTMCAARRALIRALRYSAMRGMLLRTGSPRSARPMRRSACALSSTQVAISTGTIRIVRC